jgi:hypothetical protein
MEQQPGNATSEARELVLSRMDRWVREWFDEWGELPEATLRLSDVVELVHAALTLRDEAFRAGGEATKMLRLTLEAIDTGRSEPLFIVRDVIRNFLADAAQTEGAE